MSKLVMVLSLIVALIGADFADAAPRRGRVGGARGGGARVGRAPARARAARARVRAPRVNRNVNRGLRNRGQFRNVNRNVNRGQFLNRGQFANRQLLDRSQVIYASNGQGGFDVLNGLSSYGSAQQLFGLGGYSAASAQSYAAQALLDEVDTCDVAPVVPASAVVYRVLNVLRSSAAYGTGGGCSGGGVVPSSALRQRVRRY